MATPNPRFKATIERVDGRNRARMTDPVRYSMFMASLKVGETIWWEAITKKPRRSDNINRYYWLYLGILSEQTGDDANSLHEYFKQKFLDPVYIRVRGEAIKLTRSTRTLTTGEMSEYIMRIAALTEIEPPNPQEAGYLPR